MAFELDIERDNIVPIKVIGIGGGGSNAVNHNNVRRSAASNSLRLIQTSRLCAAPVLHIKFKSARSLPKASGAGSTRIGRKAAEETRGDKKVLRAPRWCF